MRRPSWTLLIVLHLRSANLGHSYQGIDQHHRPIDLTSRLWLNRNCVTHWSALEEQFS